MRYWWVNQNQTYRHEVQGGYLWSPKRKANGHRNPFYDFMREVAPGDVVFSFAETLIRAVGLVASYAYEAPKPIEFGTAGAYWDQIGWRVDVGFHAMRLPIRPSHHMAVLAPLLPARYAPLRPDGVGQQSLYLTTLPEPLAATLIDLMGAEAHALVRGFVAEDRPIALAAIGQVQWEEHEFERLRDDPAMPDTEREAVVLARRGQGVFKDRVMRIERRCRVTGVERAEHLRASHCKPWRDASNAERLDGANGLLLTPNIDHLFDRGFIGFESDGALIVSPVAHRESLTRMGVDARRTVNVGTFSSEQRVYLEFHRENVLLRSTFLERMTR